MGHIVPDTGHVFWITGYSGAGKTAVSQALQQSIRESGKNIVLLDGDVLRSIFGQRHGYSDADRRELAMSYAHLCAELASQGTDVICATISMFEAVRDWNRAHIQRYHEIYLRVPLSVRRERDPKGLYARQEAANGSAQMVGLDQPLEEPRHPHLILDNHGQLSIDEAVARIQAAFLNEQKSP